MAEIKKKGISVDPSTGSGNTTLEVKANPANQGNRVKQTATFTITGQGVAGAPATLTANLLPAAEFVSFTNGTSMAVDKAGGQVEITGKSNSKILTFSKGAGTIIVDEVSDLNYTANGASAQSGTAIAGDPGATKEYTFSIKLSCEENETIEARTQQFTIKGESSNVTATITLNQTAGDAVLTIDPTSIDVPQNGSAVNVQVETNTTFTVA